MSAAAFLDRDGTIIQDAHYLADPNRVELIPGAAAALRTLARADYRLVVVTNQSGIARGLYTEEEFRAVQVRLAELLAREGVQLDGVFHCPHHPDHTGPCVCRKPGLGMYQAAAAQLGVDLAQSLYVGDRVHDVLPALATGGRAFLVQTGYGDREATQLPPGVEVAADLAEVARRIVSQYTDIDRAARPE